MGRGAGERGDQLRREFVAHINDASSDWLSRWRLLVEHPFYLRLLDRCARSLITAHQAPSHWIDDVKQEAVLLLARQLRSTPDLHFDAGRSTTVFKGWLRTIISRHCRESLRKLRTSGSDKTLWSSLPVESTAHRDEAAAERIDINVALLRIDKRERTVLSLYSQGFTDREIAARLDIRLMQARYLRRRALKHLTTILGVSYRREPSK